MKKLLFVFVILICLTLCSCVATADMECGIDSLNNAYININVDVHAPELEEHERTFLMNALQDIIKHYRDELDFEWDTDYFIENENTAHIELSLTKPADSFEEAFENLKEMLTDESLTPFSEISCELSDTDGEYAYRIMGTVDMHKVIENTYNSGISQGVAEYVSEELDNSSFSVTLSMPDKTKMQRLSYEEPTEISLEGKISTLTDYPLNEEQSGSRDKVLTVIIGFFGITTAISVIGIIIGVKRSKNEKE